MRWITREKVRVDRVACLWLIKKFIDSEAEFVFLPLPHDTGRDTIEDGTVFDLSNCELGHHGEAEIVRVARSRPSHPHLRPGRAYAGSHTASARRDWATAKD